MIPVAPIGEVMSRMPVITGRLTVVSFFVQPLDTGGKKLERVDPLYTESVADMLAWQAASVRHHYPDAELVVLSDQHTDLHLPRESPWRIERFHRDEDNHHIAVFRRGIEADFLSHHRGGVHLLLDPDVLIQRRLDWAFLVPAEIIVSWRDQPKWPINLGVLMVGNANAGSYFLQGLINRMLAMSSKQQRWMGDQDAACELLAPHYQGPGQAIAWAGVRVWPMPAHEINHAPEPGELPGDRAKTSRASVLHFKGGRKSLMPVYLETILARPTR